MGGTGSLKQWGCCSPQGTFQNIIQQLDVELRCTVGLRVACVESTVIGMATVP